MLTLQNLRWSGKPLLSAILQIVQHNLRSGWTRAFGPRNSARYFGLLTSMHERKTNTNLFWQVKFICFHLISATSIDKTTQLLMDNRQDLHFDNEYKIFAIKRFQLKLVKSFPIPLCVSTTDTLCHGIIVRFYRTELYRVRRTTLQQSQII